MKIRNGFVSNSSSSSFIAMGFSIQEDKEEAFLKILLELGISAEDIEKSINKMIENNKMSRKDALLEMYYDDFHNVLDKNNFRILYGDEEGVKTKDGESIIAIMLQEIDDDGGYFESGEIIIGEDENYKKITGLRDKVNPESTIKILYGTRSC